MLKPGSPRPWPIIAALLVAALLFAGLGDWQVHRLAWKRALIARVGQATTAPPLAISTLPRIAPAAIEYHRAVASGRYDRTSTTLVTATTDLGSGYWDMAVLRGPSGAVWINRGFVPPGSRRAQVAADTPARPVSVTGLVRLSEPGGTWLRANRPGAERWYSRDLPAMAQARHLAVAGPRWFIDAQAEVPRTTGAGAPVPGLTVLNFPNNHLGYAVTWFALALLSLGGAIMVWRRSS